MASFLQAFQLKFYTNFLSPQYATAFCSQSVSTLLNVLYFFRFNRLWGTDMSNTIIPLCWAVHESWNRNVADHRWQEWQEPSGLLGEVRTMRIKHCEWFIQNAVLCIAHNVICHSDVILITHCFRPNSHGRSCRSKEACWNWILYEPELGNRRFVSCQCNMTQYIPQSLWTCWFSLDLRLERYATYLL